MSNYNPPKNGLDKRKNDINKNGRPRESLTFAKLKKYSQEDIISAYWKISSMTKQQMQDLNLDKSATILELALVKRMIRGDVDIVINRILGKPKETVEVTSSSYNTTIDITGKTEEECKKIFYEIVNGKKE